MIKTLAIIATLLTITLSCQLNPNVKKILEDQPILLREVPNGQKLIVGNVDDPNRNYIWVANLKGTAYEMGLAYGTLFAEEIKDQIKNFYSYYKEGFKGLFQIFLPKFIVPLVAKDTIVIIRNILELNVLITRKYTNPRYFQEAKGIAKGAGISSKQINMFNIFPQLVRAHCTVAGVWGKASQNSHTLHMRSMDQDPNSPISKYPLIVVYHPSNKKEQVHANVGWVGFVGSLTGISQKISIGQKVWFPKVKQRMTRHGNPWTYVLRDILYDAVDMESALKILLNAHRTCAIHVGLGSVTDKTFRMMDYSYKTLNIYDDKNYSSYTQQHPQKDGIAYFDKYNQPSTDRCLADLLINTNQYGKWTMESLWRVVGNSHRTGDTQLVVFDLQTLEGLVSYSLYKNGTQYAYTRRPIYINFRNLFQTF